MALTKSTPHLANLSVTFDGGGAVAGIRAVVEVTYAEDGAELVTRRAEVDVYNRLTADEKTRANNILGRFKALVEA